MMQAIKVGNRFIGSGYPCFIIAEAGVNHNGELEKAIDLVKAAAKIGADAIKFQVFSPGDVIVKNAQKAPYQLNTTDDKESQFEMLEKLALSYKEFRLIKSLADELGIIFFATPHSIADINFLVGLEVPVIKVASMDIVNYPLLRCIGQHGLPIILSTGMSTLGEIEKGLDAIREAGGKEIILMQCVTNYPIKDNQANLRVIETLIQAFNLPVGFSDHTMSIAVPIASVVLGACVIEKHFTLDKQLKGPDHLASLDPGGFKDMIAGIRAAESALGEPIKRPIDVELINRKTMRRSLVAAVDISSGTILEERHFTLKRPGTGLGAEYMTFLIGKQAVRFIQKDQMITLDLGCPVNY